MQEDKEELEEQEDIDIAEELIRRAQANKHSSFELLTNLVSYRAAKSYQSAIRKIYNSFCDVEQGLYKSYVKMVKQGSADVSVLISLKEIFSVTKFYSDEYDLLEDMLQEFKTYMWSGHLFDAIFGERSEEDMYDFRVGRQLDGRD